MSKELEDRFYEFARRVRDYCKSLKWDLINTEYIRQLIKYSGSVAANYIEESQGWLRLTLTYEDKKLEDEKNFLIDEADQIKRILSTIVNKLK